MRERPPIPLRLPVPLTRDDHRQPITGRIGAPVLNEESRLQGARESIRQIGRAAFRLRLYGRPMTKHIFMLLGLAWEDACYHNWAGAWPLLEQARGKLRELIESATHQVARADETQRRRKKALRGAPVPPDWQARIEAGIRGNPGMSNRKIAALVGCSERTVRRWRERA